MTIDRKLKFQNLRPDRAQPLRRPNRRARPLLRKRFRFRSDARIVRTEHRLQKQGNLLCSALHNGVANEILLRCRQHARTRMIGQKELDAGRADFPRLSHIPTA